MASLDDPLTTLSGVGPRIAARLAAAGLECIEDLLYNLPRAYQDRRELVPLASLVVGQEATTEGTVVRVRRLGRPRRRRLEVELASAEGEETLLWCIWFHGHQGIDLSRGDRIFVGGVPQLYEERLQLSHPFLRRADAAAPGIEPVYGRIAGVAPGLLRRLSATAVQQVQPLPELLPTELAAELELPTLRDALAMLHRLPGAEEPSGAAESLLEAHPARRRLAFEELFGLQLALGLSRERWSGRRAWPCVLAPSDAQALRRALPFELTSGQQDALRTILKACALERPLRCLFCGDVGSGKTVVFAHACLAAVSAARQVAVLAPTALLARQHHERLRALLGPLGVDVRLLSAHTEAAERRGLERDLRAGRPLLVVGTHALLERAMPRLALLVIDEQQRFGVAQRAALTARVENERVPHLLVVSATPIPRSLALAAHGDLDLTLLTELPPGRVPVQTRWLRRATLRQCKEARQELAAALAEEQQVFVVCPRIAAAEGAGSTSASSAEQTAAALERLHPADVGVLHGGLDGAQRDRVLSSFRRGEHRILVATTMVEVGIDVPRAALMVVEEADRFGLAQLHQLRGRVGRGAGQQACCLLLSAAAPESLAGRRLAQLVATHDGFAIAEADLALRGPGELLGHEQSGWRWLRVAEPWRLPELLDRAGHAARELLCRDPMLAQRPELLAELDRRWGAKAMVRARHAR